MISSGEGGSSEQEGRGGLNEREKGTRGEGGRGRKFIEAGERKRENLGKKKHKGGEKREGEMRRDA